MLCVGILITRLTFGGGGEMQAVTRQPILSCLDQAWFAFTTFFECVSHKLCKYLQLPQPIMNK